MRNSNFAWNDGQQNVPSCGNQADIEMESASESFFGFADGNLHGDPKSSLEDEKGIISSEAICKQSAVDSEIDEMALDLDIFTSVGALFDDPWQSPVSSYLASVPDVVERKVSSESVDSDTSHSSLDNVISLDDVFDVLDEIDPFGPDLPMDAPLTTPTPHLMDDLSQCNNLYQRPIAHISDPCSSFQSFNFGVVKGLQNPSRGMVTAVRKLCELLSKPRSDHMDSVFVRLLNNTLKEMEEASQQPQSKRPRRSNWRQQRNGLSKSATDDERSFEPASIGLSRSFTSKSQSLPAISTRAGSCTGTVDLTALGDYEEENFLQQQYSLYSSQKESVIALEDTMSGFMSGFMS